MRRAATLSQAVGDRLGGPHRWLWGGQVVQGHTPCKRSGKAAVQQGDAWPPPVPGSVSVGRPVKTLSGSRARSGDVLLVPTRPGGVP